MPCSDFGDGETEIGAEASYCQRFTPGSTCLLACALDQLRCWRLQLQLYIGDTPIFISMSSKSEYFNQRQRHTTLWSLDRRPDQYLRPHLPFTGRPSRSIARLSFHTSRPTFFPLLANLLIQANATFTADQLPQAAVSPESIFSRTPPVVLVKCQQ